MDKSGKIDLTKLSLNKPAQNVYAQQSQEDGAASQKDEHMSKGSVKINMQNPTDTNGNQGGPLKTNPFAKSSTDLIKKNTVAPGTHETSDVLKSGSNSNGVGQQKRPNPFANKSRIGKLVKGGF